MWQKLFYAKTNHIVAMSHRERAMEYLFHAEESDKSAADAISAARALTMAQSQQSDNAITVPTPHVELEHAANVLTSPSPPAGSEEEGTCRAE